MVLTTWSTASPRAAPPPRHPAPAGWPGAFSAFCATVLVSSSIELAVSSSVLACSSVRCDRSWFLPPARRCSTPCGRPAPRCPARSAGPRSSRPATSSAGRLRRLPPVRTRTVRSPAATPAMRAATHRLHHVHGERVAQDEGEHEDGRADRAHHQLAVPGGCADRLRPGLAAAASASTCSCQTPTIPSSASTQASVRKAMVRRVRMVERRKNPSAERSTSRTAAAEAPPEEWESMWSPSWLSEPRCPPAPCRRRSSASRCPAG